MLAIDESLVAVIHAHCVEAYPRECCGALVGTIMEQENSAVSAVRMENVELDSPERRFQIDPAALARLEREARVDNLAVVGFYHSHPDSPAQPSITDREWAWPVYSYIIVSVEKGRVADTRSFRLDESDTDIQSAFVEEAIYSQV